MKDARYWVISDTHFGHKGMIHCGLRAPGFERRIITHWKRDVAPRDIVIHLGDVGESDLIPSLPGRKWLIRGNHDRLSDQRYLDLGWDWIGELMILRRWGVGIELTHIPRRPAEGSTWQIHGHFHKNHPDRWGSADCAALDPRHRLVSLEETGYRLLPLELIRKRDSAITDIAIEPVQRFVKSFARMTRLRTVQRAEWETDDRDVGVGIPS